MRLMSSDGLICVQVGMRGWSLLAFGNFMLEDLPQLVITSIAAGRESCHEEGNTFTTTIIINLMTSFFALITKCVGDCACTYIL